MRAPRPVRSVPFHPDPRDAAVPWFDHPEVQRRRTAAAGSRPPPTAADAEDVVRLRPARSSVADGTVPA